MTITSTPSEISYAGDDASTSFPVPFVFDIAADLKVIRTDADGNPEVLTSGFSISGGGGATGTLTLSDPLESGYTLTILDDPERKQTADYISNDSFPAETHERALDHGVRISKRLYQLIQRCIRFGDGDPVSGTDAQLASVQARKGKYLFFSPVTGAPEYADSVTGQTLSQSVIGEFLYPQTAAEVAVGVTPVNLYRVPGDLRRYGGVGDDSTDNDEAVSRWLSVGGDLFIPEGTFRASGAPYIVKSNTTIHGLGMGVSVLRNTSDATDFFRTHTRTSGVASPAQQKENIHFRDFTIDQDHSTKADAGRGIHVSWTNNATCTRVEVINAGGAGIRIDGYGATFEDGAWLESDTLPADPFTTGTAGSSTVTVNHPRHSLNTGALVTFAGVGGDIDGIPAAEFNAEHAITVVDRNTYTISTTTGASTGSVSGGGSSVTASNPRHAARWGQSTGYKIIDCRTEGCYYDVEIEGGARDGEIRGHYGVNSVHHGIRLPSAFTCKLISNHIKNCGEVAYWIDRSRNIEAIANSAPDCEKHIFALGRVDGFNISHNSGSLDTPGTNHFLTDAFQNPCGVEDGVIAYNRVTTGDSGARIQLVSKSKRVVIAGNVNINLDVAAAGNEDIDVWSNGGRSAVISSIANDQYARRFGGDIHFGPSLQSDDQPSRYTEQPPVVMSFVGVPTNNQFMFRYVFVEERYFTTNFAGSRGSIGTNPTSTLTLSIQKNGVQVGTAVFDTNGNCTFTLASPTTFDPGDVLTVRNQASADATAADICLVLR